jgi:amino acid transporter
MVGLFPLWDRFYVADASFLPWFRSFDGYSSANYVLSEVHNPVWTIKRAAPAAMIAVTLVYMLVNLAYFSVVSKRDILDGGQVAA